MNFTFQKYCYFFFVITLVLTGLNSCRKATPKHITPAFYYWQTAFRLDSTEKQYLSGKKLYIRFFDVTWDPASQKAIPNSPIHFLANPKGLREYIPIVFVTNGTLKHCPLKQMDDLADHILGKIKALSKNFDSRYSEVQLDCDWTHSTRDKYFFLLKKIKQQLHQEGITLSVTIRLHQIKYAKRTGVPPADRGMLMFYNMGDWRSPQTKNSIYDLHTASKYLSDIKDYTLPLDIALPLLRWTIVYRNKRFLTFLNDVTKDSLVQKDFLEQKNASNRFVVSKDTFAFNCSLRRNDLLRSEACSFENLMEGKKQLLSRISNTNITIALFHLDHPLLKYYSHAEIQKIFSAL